MTLHEARQKILTEISHIYEKSEAKNIAELILEKLCGQTKADRLLHKEIFLTPFQIEELKKILTRLKLNEPIQYALEEAWFYGMKFKVNSNVLIPRPETEELVDWLVKEINNEELKIKNILDIGTGSGCIPIVLKKKLPAISISAIEISPAAITIAKENAKKHITDIEFIQIDFLDEESWKSLDQYDIIVSNPPYVKQSEADNMHTRVKDHEPLIALFVPDEDALIFYKKLADFAKTHLSPGGSLYVEINENLGEDTKALFLSKGFTSVEIKKDMQGKDRMIKAIQ